MTQKQKSVDAQKIRIKEKVEEIPFGVREKLKMFIQYIKGKIIFVFPFNSDKFSISKKGSKVILKLNDGYLYDKTLKDITNFHVVGDDHYFVGKEFAETFVKAGIDIPKELFVKLFGEITKD